MAEVDFTNIANASISTPASGVSALFVDTDKKVKFKNDGLSAGLPVLSELNDNSFQTIATAAGTTTFTNVSPYSTIFTGSQVQNIVLPDATTLTLGKRYYIGNASSAILTIKTSDAATLWTMGANTDSYIVLTANGSAAGTWDVDYGATNEATGKVVTINNTMTIAGTDAQIYTFPAATGTVITDTNTQTISSAKTFSTAPVMTAALPSISKWANIALTGAGIPPIYAATKVKAETTTADASVMTYTPPAAAGVYRLSYAVDVTSATAGVVSLTVSYTNSSGAAQSNIALPLVQQAALPVINSVFTTSVAGVYTGTFTLSVNNAAAAILVKWVGGGTIAANVSCVVEQLA